MSTDDYAILVGIGSYPELGEDGTSAPLASPPHDLDAVKAWLLDPKGGGLANAANIQVKSSAPAAAADAAHPTADELEGMVANLDAIARENKRAGKGQRVGRRLYIFVSGHGFSPARQRGCLYSANAKEHLTFNVHVTGWLSWLQDAGYFREYVLWMDCCMNRMSFLQPRDPPMPPVNSSEPPRANFVAFAAQRSLKAVELEIEEDGGKIHGAFTWTLLEGLRGAAADVNGRVTGRSLADWIRNAMAARMAPHDLEDVDVAKEPEVIQEDAGLIFARGVPKLSYQVRVTFPPDVAGGGATARLWSGTPPRIVKQFSLDGTVVMLALQPGLYLIDIPAAELRQGFEVVRPMDLSISENGPSVQESAPGTVFQLDIDPADPTAEIFVVDSQFSLVDGNPARLLTSLPFGLFKIKTRIGRAVRQRIVLLDQDWLAVDPTAIVKPATVIPIQGTAATHESHAGGKAAAVRAVRQLGVGADGAAIMLMARTFSGKEIATAETNPWEGVTIVDSQGQTVIDLAREGKREGEGADPYAFCAKAVEPGSYSLRQRLDGTTIEQSLIACKGWRLEIYVLRRVSPGQAALDPRPRISVMMARLEAGESNDFEERLIETARVALADERRILSAELEGLLLQKFQNPMAGIYGGHLLLVERDRDPGRDMSQLEAVVGNLQSLVGEEHPDVAALALQCSNPRLRRSVTLAGPPMLQRSWQLLVQVARKRPTLIPAAMWERVQAVSTLPPFLVWSTNAEVKAAARRDLSRAILGEWKVEPPAAVPAAAMEVGGPAAPLGARVVAAARLARTRAAQLDVPPSGLAILQAERD